MGRTDLRAGWGGFSSVCFGGSSTRPSDGLGYYLSLRWWVRTQPHCSCPATRPNCPGSSRVGWAADRCAYPAPIKGVPTAATIYQKQAMDAPPFTFGSSSQPDTLGGGMRTARAHGQHLHMQTDTAHGWRTAPGPWVRQCIGGLRAPRWTRQISRSHSPGDGPNLGTANAQRPHGVQCAPLDVPHAAAPVTAAPSSWASTTPHGG